jgi:hypothetical protein
MNFKGFITAAAALGLVAVTPLFANAGSVMFPVAIGGTGTTTVSKNVKGSKCYAAGLVCNSGDTCQCLEQTGTLGTGDQSETLNDASFDNLFSIDEKVPLRTGNGKECYAFSGAMTFSISHGSVQFLTNGLACNSGTSSTTQVILTGGYSISSASESITGIQGVGSFTSASNTTSADTLFQMGGNILLSH